MTKRERNGLIVRLEPYSIKCLLLFESFVKIAANRHLNFFFVYTFCFRRTEPIINVILFLLLVFSFSFCSCWTSFFRDTVNCSAMLFVNFMCMATEIHFIINTLPLDVNDMWDDENKECHMLTAKRLCWCWCLYLCWSSQRRKMKPAKVAK